jgi:cytochrome P450
MIRLGKVPGIPSLIAQHDAVKHMQQCKLWNRTFSSTALKEYEVIMAKRTRQLVRGLENFVHRTDRNGRCVRRGRVVRLFYVRFNHRSYPYFCSDVLFRTDFMGDMA